jgi:hypothetical protein
MHCSLAGCRLDAPQPLGLSSKQTWPLLLPQARADKVVEPARSEVGSWLRYYLFTFLAFVLAVEVGIDLQSGGWVGILLLSPCGMPVQQLPLPCPPLLLCCAPPPTCARPCCCRFCCSCPADSPSAMQDVLYTLLVILLGVTAINERRTLL